MKKHFRNHLSRSDGHLGGTLSSSVVVEHHDRHTKRLRIPRPPFLQLYNHSDLPPDQRIEGGSESDTRCVSNARMIYYLRRNFRLDKKVLKIVTFPGFCGRISSRVDDSDSSGLHIEIGSRFIRQRRDCNFLHVVHLLHVDKGGENRGDILVLFGGAGIFLHGIFMGRIRLPNQSDSTPCTHPDGNRTIFSQDIRRL